jgi:hypothetical protein
MSREIQKATSVLYSDGVTLDDLLIQYGAIQGEIFANYQYMQWVNRDYIDGDAIQGGTIRVRRIAMSASQTYGTARAAKSGTALRNNGVDVKIDTDREVINELSAKDKALYTGGNTLQLLTDRRASFARAIGSDLEASYYNTLMNAATANGLVTVSGGSTTVDKVLILVRTLEAITNTNVDRVPREMMLLTLAPEWYDAMEQYMVTLNNPSGNNLKTLHRVQVEVGTRQGFDAIVQVKGAVAQPLVMSEEFELGKWQGSADYYAYLPYFYGTKAVMPELVLACALDEDISA